MVEAEDVATKQSQHKHTEPFVVTEEVSTNRLRQVYSDGTVRYTYLDIEPLKTSPPTAREFRSGALVLIPLTLLPAWFAAQLLAQLYPSPAAYSTALILSITIQFSLIPLVWRFFKHV